MSADTVIVVATALAVIIAVAVIVSTVLVMRRDYRSQESEERGET